MASSSSDVADDGGGALLVRRVLQAKHDFAALQIDAKETDPADVKRAYRRLALLLHPDKNASADAKDAFVRLHLAFENLYNPSSQREALAKARRRSYTGYGGGAGGGVGGKPKASTTTSTTQSWKAATSSSSSFPSSSSQPSSTASNSKKKPRSFMEILREWEEFEKEYSKEILRGRAQSEHHRAEKRRSQRADREEVEQAERQVLESVLLGDEEGEEDGGGGLEARSSNWANFLKGKKGRRRI